MITNPILAARIAAMHTDDLMADATRWRRVKDNGTVEARSLALQIEHDGGNPRKRLAHSRRAVVSLLAAIALAPLVPLRAAAASGQWRVETANQKALYPKEPFSLYNTKDREYVRYGSREYGINLVWDSTARNNFVVVRKSGGSGPIKYGELVALRETNSDGGFIRYGSRRWGINLVWSDTPVYEWKLTGGSTGSTINHRSTVSLFNASAPQPEAAPWCGKKGSSVVYGWRPFGINLVWDPPGVYYRDFVDLIPYGGTANSVLCS